METKAIEQKSSTALVEAKQMEIATVEGYTLAGGFVVGLKALENEIIGAFEGVVKAAHAAHQEALAARDKYLTPVADARKIVREKLGKFYASIEAEYEKAAKQAAAKGEIAVNVLPKVEGISVREVWKFEITDEAKVPKKFLAPDEKKIGALVKAMKDNAKIPGVRIWVEKSVAVSA